MGLFDSLIRRPMNKSRFQRPWDSEAIIQIVGIEPKGQGGGGSGNNTPPPVYWDRPEPDLPPMQFPQVPGGDDPKVMLEFLEGKVKQGTLDQEGLDRARDYLEAGGWTSRAAGT